MSNSPVTWFQVARRPRWIGAFFVAMAVAVVCALLAQWQAERSFFKAVTGTQQTVARPLDSIITAGETAPAGAVGSLAKANLMVDQNNTFIIANRIQRDGSKGYWLVSPARNEVGDLLIVTLGFSTDLQKIRIAQANLRDSIQVQAFLPFEGLLMPAEAPVMIDRVEPTIPLESLSMAQLYNLIPMDAVLPQPKIYPLFMLLTNPNPVATDLEPVTIEPASSEITVNWLSAFYAAEWAIFCGFAFFLWWRLVRDQQALENGETEPLKKVS